MGLEEMFDKAVDLRELPGRVEDLEGRVAELEGQPPPDSVGPTLVTVNQNGLIAEIGEELPIEAQGDLIAGDVAGEPATFPVGVDGEALFADSAEPKGMRWGELPGPETPGGDSGVVSGSTAIEVGLTLSAATKGLLAVAIGGGSGGIPDLYWNGAKLNLKVNGSGPFPYSYWSYPNPATGAGTLKVVPNNTNGCVYAVVEVPYVPPAAETGERWYRAVIQLIKVGAEFFYQAEPAAGTFKELTKPGVVLGHAHRGDPTFPVSQVPGEVLVQHTFPAAQVPNENTPISVQLVRGAVTEAEAAAGEKTVSCAWQSRFLLDESKKTPRPGEGGFASRYFSG